MPSDSISLGRLRLLHLREQTEAVGETMEVERGRFDRLRDGGPPRVVSAFNLFQTPPELARRLAGLLLPAPCSSLPASARILEPSAGLGRLYEAVRRRSTAPVVLVELAAECAAELYRETATDPAATLIQADFLACDADRLGGLFSHILMNPPFKMGRDIKHIEHARRLLAPGGRLVALCAAGPRQRRRLQPAAAGWIDLPPGSFKSEGTNVAAAMCVFQN